jgi:hypothetical protein
MKVLYWPAPPDTLYRLINKRAQSTHLLLNIHISTTSHTCNELWSPMGKVCQLPRKAHIWLLQIWGPIRHPQWEQGRYQRRLKMFDNLSNPHRTRTTEHNCISSQIAMQTCIHLIELRVQYNHCQRKSHTKLFVKTFSCRPKPLFCSFTPSFERERNLSHHFYHVFPWQQGKEKTIFNPNVLLFK